MELTKNEIISIVALLESVIYADGKREKCETDFISLFLREYMKKETKELLDIIEESKTSPYILPYLDRVPHSHFHESKYGQYYSIQTISEMSSEKKEWISRLLEKYFGCDKEIHPGEIVISNILNKLLGLNIMINNIKK